MKLGINGLGRIGKLALWHHVARKYFDELVVNIGRDVGTSLHDVAHYIEMDSTYGPFSSYLYGYKGGKVIEEVDDNSGSMKINGVKVRVLRKSRDPKEIGWSDYDVRLVVDTTGQFLDPTIDPEGPKACVRGHLESGAAKVIVSAPFKIKDKSLPMPEDCVTTVMGINEGDYEPRVHKIISSASCTTTCLAHMMKPLLDYFGPESILTASMATVHAMTGSQEVLDRLPKGGARDLRKSRGVMNNIILTTTGAANTLGLVIPEMKHIGFMAESVRIPTTTGSLIILVVNLQEDPEGDQIRRQVINNIYKEAAERDSRGYLHYTDSQNVSCDIIAHSTAGAIIEGHETHTRTAEVNIDMGKLCRVEGKDMSGQNVPETARIAITQAVIYGWYDNELGGYVNMMGERTVSIAESM